MSLRDTHTEGGTLGLLMALPHECGPLRRRIRDPRADSFALAGTEYSLPVTRGYLGERPVVLALSGAGSERAAKAAQALIGEGRVSELLILGFAGGVDPKVRAGALVVASALVDGESGEVVSPRTAVNWEDLPDGSYDLGPVLCLEHVLRGVSQKREAFQRWQALAVDMESLGAARVARDEAIPWQAVRGITDPAHMAMPLDFNLYMRDGRIQVLRIVVAALSSPQRLLGLARLGRHSAAAARALAYFAESWAGRGRVGR